MLVNFAKFRLFIRIGVSKYDIGLNPTRALLFFKRNEKTFFESTLFSGLLRRVIPEKGSPAVAKLVPQHPFDAFGRSNCM